MLRKVENLESRVNALIGRSKGAGLVNRKGGVWKTYAMQSALCKGVRAASRSHCPLDMFLR